MSWAELEWPDLSLAPEAFPEPRPRTPPPPRPEAPPGVAERVRRAEVTRGIVVPLCFLMGGGLACAGTALYGRAPGMTVALVAAGVVVAFVVSALATLRIGPTWEQRQQHWRLLRWEGEWRAWLARERAAYLAELPLEQRAALERALRAYADSSAPPRRERA